MKMKTSVLLTGAVGTVGLEVLKMLVVDKTVDLCVFDLDNRKNRHMLSPYQNRIRVIYGNIAHATDIRRIPSGFDYVIHLAALIPPLADKRPVLAESVNVSGTQKLIYHLESTSPDCFFMYSSSISVYGDRLHTPGIRVGDPLFASEGDEYALTKIRAEKIIMHSRLHWCIFRLTAIMKNHKLSPLMFHMPLDTLIDICIPEVAANAFVKAIPHARDLTGNIYNLGGGTPCVIRYGEFLDRSFSMYGLGKSDFPPFAFADHNFHCGVYADGDILENLLHFRKCNMEIYFREFKSSVKLWKKVLATLFRVPLKWYLLLQSEPFRAFHSHDLKAKLHFFKPEHLPQFS